jgi:hypothetical protein
MNSSKIWNTCLCPISTRANKTKKRINTPICLRFPATLSGRSRRHDCHPRHHHHPHGFIISWRDDCTRRVCLKSNLKLKILYQ